VRGLSQGDCEQQEQLQTVYSKVFGQDLPAAALPLIQAPSYALSSASGTSRFSVAVDPTQLGQSELVSLFNGSTRLRQLTLAPNTVQVAQVRAQAHELIYCYEGIGTVWLYDKRYNHEEFVQLHPGVSFAVPAGVCAQIRSGMTCDRLSLTVFAECDSVEDLSAVQGAWPLANEQAVLTVVDKTDGQTTGTQHTHTENRMSPN
jgi:hypothetical protein